MYQTFDHTADIGLQMDSDSLESLFEDAGKGLFSILLENVDSVEEKEQIAISVPYEPESLDDLMYDWLCKLLYLFEAEKYVFHRFRVRFDLESEENQLVLRAELFGESFDPKRHVPDFDVKAITYHLLAVQQINERFTATVILDL